MNAHTHSHTSGFLHSIWRGQPKPLLKLISPKDNTRKAFLWVIQSRHMSTFQRWVCANLYALIFIYTGSITCEPCEHSPSINTMSYGSCYYFPWAAIWNNTGNCRGETIISHHPPAYCLFPSFFLSFFLSFFPSSTLFLSLIVFSSLSFSFEFWRQFYLISTAYFSATGGGYDKLEVYKCSDGAKAPAVTREMVIGFPSCVVSWRHKEFHMVIPNAPPKSAPQSPPRRSTSRELAARFSHLLMGDRC